MNYDIVLESGEGTFFCNANSDEEAFKLGTKLFPNNPWKLYVHQRNGRKEIGVNYGKVDAAPRLAGCGCRSYVCAASRT